MSMLCRCTKFIWALALICVAVPETDPAGPIPEPLKPVSGTLKDTVASVGSVRELADGRLLFPLDRSLAIGDFGSGATRRLTSIPNGFLVAMAGDSTLDITTGNGWVMLADTAVLGMLEPANPMVGGIRRVLGANDHGFVLALASKELKPDSNMVWLYRRQTGSRDSIGRIAHDPALGPDSYAPVYTVDEQAALALDGWIAILRAHPYRVDWRSPAGEWTRGAPISVPTIKLDQRERDALIAQRTLVTGHGPEFFPATTDWPPTVEPFGRGSLLLTPTGEALVMRIRTADAPDTRYDVIDRHGVRVRQLELPADQRIVGFGAHAVYVRVWASKIGGKGIIQRHPWP